ncbi:hypothetical protein ACXXDK_15635 (plasmid) [Deinococcus sp. PESE-38]
MPHAARLFPQLAAPLALGLDAGGSGTQWVLLRGPQRVAAGTTLPLTAALLGTPAGEAALRSLRDALPALPGRVHAGLPGLSAGSAQAETARAHLALSLGLPPQQVSVEGDLDLAYRAHFAPGEGILIYAGTGSIAYHVTANGDPWRAGGRGYRIGDDGAGASLGRGRCVTSPTRWTSDMRRAGLSPRKWPPSPGARLGHPARLRVRRAGGLGPRPPRASGRPGRGPGRRGGAEAAA